MADTSDSPGVVRQAGLKPGEARDLLAVLRSGDRVRLAHLLQRPFRGLPGHLLPVLRDADR